MKKSAPVVDKKKENPQKAHRFERLAEELRANLKRRKEKESKSLKGSVQSSNSTWKEQKEN